MHIYAYIYHIFMCVEKAAKMAAQYIYNIYIYIYTYIYIYIMVLRFGTKTVLKSSPYNFVSH